MTEIMTRHQPAGWKLHRLGQLFEERREKVSDKDFRPLSVTMNGIVPQLDTAAKSDDGDNRKLVQSGDYAINSRSDRKGSGGISPYDGSVSLISIVLKPKNIYPAYAHHLLRSPAFQEEFYRWGHGIVADLWTTRYSDMKNIRLNIPDLDTQKAIADFLDCETARIDQLIEKKQHLVSVLQEKSTTLIETLITGKDRPDFRVIAGRSNFVRGMPKNWTESRLRFGISKIEQGWSPQCEARQVSNDEWGVLKLGAITTGTFREESHKALPEELSPRLEYTVRSSDVLIARASGSPSLVGKACYVRKITRNLMISDKHYRIKLVRSTFDPEFFVYLINSQQSRMQIEMRLSSADGMARNIGQDVIKNIWCAIPSHSEQLDIMRRVDVSEKAIRKAVSSTFRSIKLLNEFRSALITAAVTGQIDVASWRNRGTTDHHLDQIEEEMSARGASA